MTTLTWPLTVEQIDRLEAGPEIDALVAEYVLGWALQNCAPLSEVPATVTGAYQWWMTPSGARFGPLPHFSRDITEAWFLLEQFDFVHLARFSTGIWRANLRSIVERSAEAETAPLAIVKAALKAKLDHIDAPVPPGREN